MRQSNLTIPQNFYLNGDVVVVDVDVEDQAKSLLILLLAWSRAGASLINRVRLECHLERYLT